MNYDLLVVANPVWETTWMLSTIDFTTLLGGGASTETRAFTAEPAVADGGGSALNTACALAMAGRKVLAVGRVGDDAAGHASLAALRHRGVETRVEVVAGRTTKRNHLYVEVSTAATAFQVDLPAEAVPPWDELPEGLLEARILWLDRLAVSAHRWLEARRPRSECPNGLNRNSGIGSNAAEERFWRALPMLDYLQIPEREDLIERGPGGKDPVHPKIDGTDDPIGEHRRPDQEPAGAVDPPPPMSEATVVDSPGTGSGSRRESPAVSSDTHPVLAAVFDPRKVHHPSPLFPLGETQVAAILSWGMSALIRTRGARGIVLHAKRAGAPTVGLELPAQATRVVDPTGAGDAFAAGFLDGVLSGCAPRESAERGIDWATRACRYPGARGWLDREPPARSDRP